MNRSSLGLAQGSGSMGSDRGAVLIVVVILSAVVLAVMTTMLYMVTVSTQIGGLQKRYRTAKDAALGGWEAIRQVLDAQNDGTRIGTLQNAMTSAGMNFLITTNAACANVPLSGTVITGYYAKIMTSKDVWNGSCDSSLTINTDPNINPRPYDFRMELGTGTKYTVYAKIVHTVQGNTSAGSGDSLEINTGAGGAEGGLDSKDIPSLYTLEVQAENRDNPSERAKYSILYQY